MRLNSTCSKDATVSRYRRGMLYVRIFIASCFLFLLSASAGAQPIRTALIPVPVQTRVFWDDGVAKLTVGLHCSAQATAQNPVPVEFLIINYAVTDYTQRAWRGYFDLSNAHALETLRQFRFEWESDDSDGYRSNYGSIEFATHRDAFIGTNSKGEEYVRGFITIPSEVGGKTPLEVAQDAARKSIPMKWTISHPGNRAIFYIGVDWNSIMGSCGRDNFVGGDSEGLSQAQISNARFHVQQASKALGLGQDGNVK